MLLVFQFDHQSANMTQLQRFNLVDPFQGASFLSLHPRSLRDSKVSQKSSDLEDIHHHMNSMTLQNPDKHFEEAKSIIDCGSEFLHAKENEADMKENEYPQKNRPALARKRAKFSLKTDIRQPSTILEPVFHFDQLQDPVEIFAAYEKFENTVKELKRQRGEYPNDVKILTTARQRHPEIPRRRSSYLHHVYSSQSQSDTSFSQETLQETFEILPVHGSQQESATPDCQSKKKEVPGSISKDEDKFNKLFDDLMSSNIANLDEIEALSYLKEWLKIKPVNTANLQLPNFHNIPTIDLISSVKNLIKDQSILPDTLALPDSSKEITIGEQEESPDQPSSPSSSPTPPRRPICAISTPRKHFPQSTENESNDPFSAHDIDLFPTTTTSEFISRHSTHANKNKDFPVSASKDKELPASASKHSISEPPITMEDVEQDHAVEETDVVTDMQKNKDIQVHAEDLVQKATSPTKLNSIVEYVTDNAHLHSVQNVEENVHPKKSINYCKKTRASKVDLKKKRHSLAGAGSSWTTGVRRSNRL